jgi:hypothetical protein
MLNNTDMIRIYKRLLLWPAAAVLFCWSCSSDTRSRQTLLSQLPDHYADPRDSLKRQAVLFLMKYPKSRIADTTVDPYIQLIRQYHQDEAMLTRKMDSLKGIDGDWKYVPDSLALTAAYIKKNIDQAFATFEHCGWKGEVSFNTFCEYVLPYCIGQEPLENWRDSVLERNYYLKNICRKKNLTAACEDLNRYLGAIKPGFEGRFGSKALHLPPLPFSSLDLLSMGSCKEFCYHAIFLMRAAGMPVTMDFSPQHGNNSGGHEWVALVRDSGGSIPFDIPSLWGLGSYKPAYIKDPRIYRYTFSEDSLSHVRKRGKCRFLPAWFNEAAIRDVTELYMPVSNVTIPTGPANRHAFVYLNCFDNAQWVPIAWTMAGDSLATFEKMGREIVYLATRIDGKDPAPTSLPFILDANGHTRFLVADPIHRQTVIVDRKFPMRDHIAWFHSRMLGGRFQGANRPDFSDGVNLFTVTRSPGDSINIVTVKAKGPFRYIRYLAPGNSGGNVAEINFYGKGQELLKGRIIGTEGSYNDVPANRKEAVFDGDPLTFYDSRDANNAWVGLDLGSPSLISSIDYRARSDNNGMNLGDDYELLYWSAEGKWQSAGRMIARSYTLTFTGVPSGALYLLHNHTRGREERIFTYEQGRQVWW